MNVKLDSVAGFHLIAGGWVWGIGDTYECLRINCSLHAPRAVTVGCAIGDAVGHRVFTFYPGAPAQSGFYADPERDDRLTRAFLTAQGLEADLCDEMLEGMHEPQARTVGVTTLSALFRDLALERVDLLKVDAEGAELDVLGGITTGDWPRIAQVVMEVHGGPERLSAVVEGLVKMGFEAVVEPMPLFEHPELRLVHGTRPDGR